jgi:hypothetical protein
MTEIKSQKDAIEKLAKWRALYFNGHGAGVAEHWRSWAAEWYADAVNRNVAAITAGVHATDSGVVVDACMEMAIRLTHATIAALVDGAEAT